MADPSDSKVATMAIPSEPTVEAMIEDLRKTGRLPSEPVAEIRVVTRPPLLITGLVVAGCGLVAMFTILSASLALGMRELVAAIVEHRYAEAHPPPPPLPPAEDLLEAAVFAQAAKEFPQHLAKLYALRAEAHLAHRDPAGADRDFREAAERARVPLGADERLAWAQALMALERRTEAQDVLYALKLDSLTDEQRHLAVDLLSRCRGPVLSGGLGPWPEKSAAKAEITGGSAAKDGVMPAASSESPVPAAGHAAPHEQEAAAEHGSAVEHGSGTAHGSAAAHH